PLPMPVVIEIHYNGQQEGEVLSEELLLQQIQLFFFKLVVRKLKELQGFGKNTKALLHELEQANLVKQAVPPIERPEGQIFYVELIYDLAGREIKGVGRASKKKNAYHLAAEQILKKIEELGQEDNDL
ncbi:MAG: hypothetical protein ACFFBD_25790, partial [Candidatus Hodarchaeota archaeon]